MATYGEKAVRTFESNGDLSNNIYEIMRVQDGGQTVDVASQSTSTEMVGVLQNKPDASGRHATVAYAGESKLRAGAAVSSVGVFLTTNGSGRATAAASGDMVVGRAMSTAGADGEVIEAQLSQPWRLSGAV